MEDKKHLRYSMKKRLGGFSVREHTAKSTSCSRLLDELIQKTIDKKPASCLLAYHPFGTEVNILPAVTRAITGGVDVCFPRITGTEMMFCNVTTLESGFRTNSWGIPEPNGPHFDIAGITGTIVLVVPGLAFDTNGGRLGRGKGFYDRFLENSCYPLISCGVCFEEQLVSSVPRQNHDKRVDMLLTDKRHIHCTKTV